MHFITPHAAFDQSQMNESRFWFNSREFCPVGNAHQLLHCPDNGNGLIPVAAGARGDR